MRPRSWARRWPDPPTLRLRVRRWDVAQGETPTNEHIVELLEAVLRELSELKADLANLAEKA